MLTLNVCFSQNKIGYPFYSIQTKEFSSARNEKYGIVNYWQEAIPEIIEMLKDTSNAKLKYTVELIYLGLKKFYGLTDSIITR